jgi:hypothetical protein
MLQNVFPSRNFLRRYLIPPPSLGTTAVRVISPVQDLPSLGQTNTRSATECTSYLCAMHSLQRLDFDS